MEAIEEEKIIVCDRAYMIGTLQLKTLHAY